MLKSIQKKLKQSMNSDYLIVHKSLLPQYLEKVIEARELLNTHEVETITQAVKKVGISRNTYYKYKDFVYEDKQVSRQHAVISAVLKDSPGTLSSLISMITKNNCNNHHLASCSGFRFSYSYDDDRYQ